MRRRLLQIVLPILLAGLLASGFAVAGWGTITERYRAAVKQDVLELISLATRGDATTTESLAATLKDYGYLAGDYYVASSADLAVQSVGLLLAALGIFAASLLLYFWLLDLWRGRQVRNLVTYLHNLSRQIYDLQPAANREGELSLLQNELYKVAVLLQEAANQNQAQKQQLQVALADISHQLRTPLTSLQIMVDNLRDEPEMPADVRQDFLSSIGRQVEGMSELVTTLLNLAKLDNGAIVMYPTKLVVGDWLRSVIDKVAVLAELREVTVVLRGDLQAQIALDRRWQSEAISNVVKNCLEHSPAGRQVIIQVEDCPLFLRIAIEDFGDGIAPSDQRHIFERFYQAQNSIDGHVGIGLSFARTIIQTEQGEIKVRSQVGKGTKFTITYYRT